MFDFMEHRACGNSRRGARRNHRLINRAARVAARRRLPAPYGGARTADDWRRTLRHGTWCCDVCRQTSLETARGLARGSA